MRWVSLLVLMAVLTGCGGAKSYRGRTDKLVRNHALLSEQRWGLELVSMEGEYASAGNMKGLRHLHLNYYSNQLMEVEEAREAVTDSLETLLRSLNRDETLRPHLLEYPLTIENLTMRLQLEHFFGDYFEPIYIGVVTVEDGYITYYSHNNKIKQREPYNKALRSVAENQEQEIRRAEAASAG